MPKITAWKCPHTGTLFEDEKKYRAHLKRLSADRVRQRTWKSLVGGLEDKISKIQLVNNMQEWCEFVMQNQEDFIVYGVLNDNFDSRDMKAAMEMGAEIEFPTIKSIKIVRSKWNEQLSNSHNCPRDGHSNFCRDPDKDRGYPGWHGRITLCYEDEDAKVTILIPGKKRKKIIRAPSVSNMAGKFGCDSSITSLNTGSGGGGGGGSYQAYMFMSDLPNMRGPVEKALYEMDKDKTWAVLNEKHYREDTSSLNNIAEGAVGNQNDY